jgi:phospholipid/cholesterol/gamma-HCH transport system substrate-binding protein
VLVLGGNGRHTYYLTFENAGQLVNDDDVQVGGRRIGSVQDIELTDDNQARIKIDVEEPFAPLREGSTAVIRLTSLSGVANRYIALTPAPEPNRRLDDGATLHSEATTAPVDLDELFNTLDPRTRRGLRQVVQGFSDQYQGKGRQANESIRYFSPALSSTRRLADKLTQDEGRLTDFIVNSSRAVTALAERRDDLAGLVSNTNTTARAIGRENASLQQALGLLPTTLRRANTTFVNLRSTLDDLDPLVDESKPATRELAPFLRRLRPLVADARPTIRDLRRLVSAPGDDNDLVEATEKLPRLQRTATPAFRNSRQALIQAQPVLEFARPYTPDLVGWLRDYGQGAANYDANGHFARVQPMFNSFQLTDSPEGQVLQPRPTTQRMSGLQTGAMKRCPGAATQRPPDGSAPFTDGNSLSSEDCDPNLALPGP